jgi:hypothetical protein
VPAARLTQIPRWGQLNRPTNDLRIATVAPLPQVVAERNDPPAPVTCSIALNGRPTETPTLSTRKNSAETIVARVPAVGDPARMRC